MNIHLINRPLNSQNTLNMNIHLINRPPNSQDMNILNLDLSREIESFKDQTQTRKFLQQVKA